MAIESKSFGKYPASGEEIHVHILQNDSGMSVHILEHGATIQRLVVPDAKGKETDVVLGFDTIGDYLNADINPYAGAVIGRYAGRIPNGVFSLDGKKVSCATNAGSSTLHGGLEGFDRKLWKALEKKVLDEALILSLGYTSEDGEEGFPGKLEATITFELSRKTNILKISLEATSDELTICNLTHHDYFNLGGHGSGDILDHMLAFSTGHYFPMLENLTPIGAPSSVLGTPFDFRNPKAIRDGIEGCKEDKQLLIGSGYDHSFQNVEKATANCTAYSPKSGIKMEVKTSQFVTHLYTGNFVDSKGHGKNGASYTKHAGFAIETQNLANGINNPAAPDSTLAPGQVYQHSTTYTFSIKK